MSEKCDKLPQVRVSEENRKWMDQYRNLIGFRASYSVIANMLMEKGRPHMPMPTEQPDGKRRK